MEGLEVSGEERNVLIDDMHNTVCNEHVRHHNARRVDENSAVRVDGDLEVFTIARLKRSSVLEGGRVADGAGYDVVAEHIGEFFRGKTLQGVTDGVEGLVCGGEDGDVGGVVDGIEEIGGVGGAAEGS
jgi:hypothetical protein